MFLRDRVIVLKNHAFSESDLIIRGINSKGCQLSFIAKGALKSKRRFSGAVLEPTAYIELEYRPSKRALHNLREAWLLEDFSALREDYLRLQTALYFVQVTSRLSHGETEDSKELFHILGNALTVAQTSPCLDILKICFQEKVLFLQGVLPKELIIPEILKSPLSQHSQIKIAKESKNNLLQKLDQSFKLYLDG